MHSTVSVLNAYSRANGIRMPELHTKKILKRLTLNYLRKMSWENICTLMEISMMQK